MWMIKVIKLGPEPRNQLNNAKRVTEELQSQPGAKIEENLQPMDGTEERTLDLVSEYLDATHLLCDLKQSMNLPSQCPHSGKADITSVSRLTRVNVEVRDPIKLLKL